MPELPVNGGRPPRTVSPGRQDFTDTIAINPTLPDDSVGRRAMLNLQCEVFQVNGDE